MTVKGVLHKVVENYPTLVVYLIVVVTANFLLNFIILWVVK